MMFNQSYYNSMDRGYYIPLEDGEQPASEVPENVAPDIGLDIKDIGISAPPFGSQLEGLKSKIFQGAKKVELGFMGSGKGSMQGGNTTPGMFGKDERMDIRELAKINKVQLTTHASPNIGSLSGYSQNGFEDQARDNTLQEVKRAIDFAADTTNGGAVVVHAQEYPRAIHDEYGDQFQGYQEEKEKAIRHLVDKRTGQIIPVRKNQPMYEPKYKEYEKDPENYWVDVDGNPIAKSTENPRELFRRVPEWDASSSEFKTEKREWKDFEAMAERWNRAHSNGEKKTPEEMWFRIQIENAVLRNKGSALYHATSYEESKEDYEAADKLLKFYKEIEGKVPKEEQWRLLREQPLGRRLGDFNSTTKKLPSEILEERKRSAEQYMRFIHESSAAAEAEASKLQNDIKETVSISKYASGKTADTIAQAAIYAMRREKKPSKEGMWGWDVRQGDAFEKPLFVAIENFFPNVRGGHPDEVKKMVIDAREDMSQKLQSHHGFSRGKRREGGRGEDQGHVGHVPRKHVAKVLQGKARGISGAGRQEVQAVVP